VSKEQPLAGQRLRQEPDPDQGLAEREVPQQPPPCPVRGGVEGPGRAGPRDPQPQGVAVHLEGVAIIGGAPGHDRDRGRLVLRRILEAAFAEVAGVVPTSVS